jgi:hypothetical protein
MKSVLAVIVGFWTSLALAEPGELHPHTTLDFVEDRLEETARAELPPCTRGRLCISAAGQNTHAVAPTLATVKPTLEAPPSFTRTLAMVSRTTGSAMRDDSPWTVALSSSHVVRPGTIICLIFDARDKKAIAARQVFALYQLEVQATGPVALKLRLSPDDGFTANHAYLIRLIQLAHGRELPVGESELNLL